MNVTLPALARIAEIESRFGTPPATSDPGFAQVLTDTERSAAAGGTVLTTRSPATAVERASSLLQSMPPVSLTPTAAATPLPVGATVPTVGLDPSGGVPPTVPYAATFTAAAGRHHVPAELLASVGFVESRYDPHAVSPAGARGLMQLMPFVEEELGVDAFDPTQAIDGAARLLAQHHGRFGTWELALAAYFAGPGAVRGAGNQIPSPRAQQYVDKVVSRMEQM